MTPADLYVALDVLNEGSDTELEGWAWSVMESLLYGAVPRSFRCTPYFVSRSGSRAGRRAYRCSTSRLYTGGWSTSAAYTKPLARSRSGAGAFSSWEVRRWER